MRATHTNVSGNQNMRATHTNVSAILLVWKTCVQNIPRVVGSKTCSTHTNGSGIENMRATRTNVSAILLVIPMVVAS